MTFEVEQKFPVETPKQLENRLGQLGARPVKCTLHRDTYYNHPCRDFAETREALRIRLIDGVAHVTYKGPKLPGKVKARREMEWSLGPEDADGQKTAALWRELGFREVASVTKQRQHYRLEGTRSEFDVVLDRVEKLGAFAEIELVVTSEREVASAREKILALADQLELRQAEPRSYLQMILALETSI